MEGVLEGLLFLVGSEGLSKDQIKEIMNIDDKTLEQLINSLKKEYDNNKRGINLENLGGMIKLVTKKEYKEYYEKLVTYEINEPLSEQALETLAIIAYNEPITRSMVEEIRGVDSTYIIRKLVLRNFIKELGRSELPGRPILYGVTKEFLDYLGLSSKDDLPKLEPITINEEETDLYQSKYSE